jgi:hypothetical protein
MSSHQFFDNTTLANYDPTNYSEYDLIDSLDSEFLQIDSQLLYLWKVNYTNTYASADEIDKMYGEVREVIYEPEPIRVYMKTTQSPVITELQRFGISQTGEIIFVYNRNDTIDKLGREPSYGDIIKVNWFEADGKYSSWFYKISTNNPGEQFRDRYFSSIVIATQTALSDVPPHILNYTIKD